MTVLAHTFLIAISAFCRRSENAVSKKVSELLSAPCEKKRHCTGTISEDLYKKLIRMELQNPIPLQKKDGEYRS
jgi:hypothetical protein